MAAIALRSPQYKTAVADTGTPLSAKITISIDGTIEYTLVKPTSLNQNMLWEIAELCRDFINITFNGTYTAETLAIISTLTSHASTDGTGTALTTDTFTDVGYDGYGTFMEGDNPEIPFSNRPRWLLNTNPSTLNEYYIYVPNNTAGVLPYIAANASLNYQSFTSSATEINSGGGQYDVDIIRIDCTKYGYGHKITLVNTTNKKQEQFQRNIITSTGSYNVNTHTKQDYNTVANTSISLSSGYYPEWANQWFEQLLLSEQVWLTRTDPFDSSADEVVPVNVKKSNMIKKTSLNERLIDYTFEFDMSFDYINNIR